MATLKRITAPDDNDLPISLDDAKEHLRIDKADTTHDSYITTLIRSASTRVENVTGVCLRKQSWKFSLDGFPGIYGTALDPCSEIKLPRGPLLSLDKIEYIDWNGQTQTLDAAFYQIDDTDLPPRLRPAYGLSWPAYRPQMNAVAISYTCGPDDDEGPADSNVRAVKFLIAHWFENRESASDVKLEDVPDTLVASLCEEFVPNLIWPD